MLNFRIWKLPEKIKCMRYMYVLCGNMMNDPQHCCLYSPLGYLELEKITSDFTFFSLLYL